MPNMPKSFSKMYLSSSSTYCSNWPKLIYLNIFSDRYKLALAEFTQNMRHFVDSGGIFNVL